MKLSNRLRRALTIGILATMLVTGVVVAVSGLGSIFSVRMSGVSDSLKIIEMSGVSDSTLIVNTGYLVVYAPTGLVLTYVADHECLIEWTKGVNAENSMVRACVDRVPADRDDGYLVYLGTGSSISDFDADLDQTVVWYRVWSQASAGHWEDEGIYDSIGGAGLTFLGFLAIPIVFMIAFFWKKSNVLAFVAAGGWVLLGFFAFGQSDSTVFPITDVYMGLFWLCIAATIGCVLLPAVMREKPSKDDIYPEEVDEVTGEKIVPEEPKEKKRRPRVRKLFDKTGQL